MEPTPETVRLDWPPDHAGGPAELAEAAFARGAVRVEVLVSVTDERRRLLHGAAFRREGRLRSAYVARDGTAHDAYLYARLADDPLDGEEIFSTVMNAVLPRTRVIGHAVFRDRDARVLLLQVSYKRDWELPGGVVEPYESPREGCRREVIEEIGLDRDVERLLCVDWLPPYLGWDDAVELIFDGGVLSPDDVAAMVLGAGEIVAAHWVAADDVGRYVSPLAARRLRWLLANPEAPPALFEDGRPVGRR